MTPKTSLATEVPVITWPSLSEAEEEALSQQLSCYCSGVPAYRQPCAACRAARMIRALLTQVRERM